jgi:PAS domain S-box-containing protein
MSQSENPTSETITELMALKALGVALPEDLKQMSALLNGENEPQGLLREMDDLLADAFAWSSVTTRPPAILRDRVLVATEPTEARVVTDAACRIVSISPAFTDLCGYQFSEIKGKKPGSFLQGPGTDPRAIVELREAIQAEAECTVELLNYHKSGSPYWVQIKLTPIFEKTGELTGYCALEKKLN